MAVDMRKNGNKRAENPETAKRNRKKSNKTIGLMIALGAVAVLILIIAFYFIFFVKPPTNDKTQINSSQGSSVIKSDKTDDTKDETIGNNTAEEEKKDNDLSEEEAILDMADEINVDNAKQKDGFFTILVVGTDKSGLLTDTIVVATFDTNTKSASLLNVPRDTLASNSTSSKYYKINSMYSKGGISRTIKELKNLLGYEVNRHIIIDFDAFTNLINAIGGVEINVPRRMYYSDPDQDLLIDIKAGKQTLDGEDCLGYMRFRKGYANQDYGRIEAQQVVYKAVAKKLATPSTLLKLPDLVNVILENVETDLTLGEMIWIGTNYITMNMDDLVTETLPSYGTTLSDGLSYVIPYRNDTIKLVNELFNPYVDDIKNVIHASDFKKGSLSSRAEDEDDKPDTGSSTGGSNSSGSNNSGSKPDNDDEPDNNSGSVSQPPEWLNPSSGSSGNEPSTGGSEPEVNDPPASDNPPVGGGTIDIVE